MKSVCAPHAESALARGHAANVSTTYLQTISSMWHCVTRYTLLAGACGNVAMRDAVYFYIGAGVTPAFFIWLGAWALKKSLQRLGRSPTWSLGLVFLLTWIGVVVLGLVIGRYALGIGYWAAILLLVSAFIVRVNAGRRAT